MGGDHHERGAAGATGAPTPTARRPRRAVRPSGTVGTDETVLRSAFPAPPARTAGAPTSGAPASAASTSDTATPLAGTTAAPVPDRSSDALLAARSADDSDLGWGGGRDDNDDRLRQDKPPHW